MVLFHDQNTIMMQQKPISKEFNLLEEVILKRLHQILTSWSSADVRTVPNVMYQVRCGPDEADESIEYQINWFIDCAETHIHNHRSLFDSYCLEGEYEEKIWDIIDENDDKVTYQFVRYADNTLSPCKAISGTLQHIATRYHFPGNKLHMNTELFHSITPVIGTKERVLTFLVKKKYSAPVDTFILSSTPYVETLENDMRLANKGERQQMYFKLNEVLKKFQSELHIARNLIQE